MSDKVKSILAEFCRRLKLLPVLGMMTPVAALGTTYWSPLAMFRDAHATASYTSSVVGFGVALIAGHVATAAVGATLRIAVVEPRDSAEKALRESWTPAIVGTLERCLYVFVFYVAVWQTVPVWLALKSVNRWNEQQRTHFNTFLIGTLLSLAFGFAGAAIIVGNPL